MAPKEKSKELVSKFEYQNNYGISEDTGLKGIDEQLAKQCALIAVDEILDLLSFELGHDSTAMGMYEYYQEVKQEIEKL